nr:HAMP domain-containing sensor histidine kinase [uncultured Oscillibacter sp.]
MIRRLRIKFVCINMAIVTIMLCAIFVMVLSFTQANLERESIGMMQTVARDPMRLGAPGEAPSSVHLPYFALQLGPGGDLEAAGGGYYDLTDSDMLRELVSLSTGSTRQSGVLSEYGLRYCRVVTPTSQCIVFADISSEISTMDNLVRDCLLIGAFSFLAFFIISLLLARWAVKPVEVAWTQQRQFVADASHELKTPLTVILSNTQLLKDEGADEETRTRLTENIFAMSHQMRSLIESLLDLARVDSGLGERAFSRVELSKVVTEALLPFEPVFYERDLDLDSRIEDGLFVQGSTPHLKQVTDILLDNAQKYAAPQSRVEVSLGRSGRKHCLLSVATEGASLTPKELKNIFKRFYRTDTARSRDGSYGLGLSIAEGIVKGHRGVIWAESRGGVNTFFVRLPLYRGK